MKRWQRLRVLERRYRDMVETWEASDQCKEATRFFEETILQLKSLTISQATFLSCNLHLDDHGYLRLFTRSLNGMGMFVAFEY